MRRFMSLATLLTVWHLAVLPAAAQQEWNAAERAAEIAPLLSDYTIVVAHADASVDLRPLGEKLADLLARNGDRTLFQQEWARLMDSQTALRNAGLRHIYVVADLGPDQRDAMVAAFSGERSKLADLEEALAEQLRASRKPVKVGDLLVVGSERGIERVKNQTTVARPDIAAALADCDRSDAQIVFVPSQDLRRVVVALFELPDGWGQLSGETLANGIHRGMATIRVNPDFEVKLWTKAADADAARELAEAIPPVIEVALQERLPEPLRGVLTKIAAPQHEGDRLTWTFDDNDSNSGQNLLLAGLLAPVQAARAAAQRSQCTGHLKKLALAMHNYHDVHQRFPAAASRDADGKPLLSWRVHLLPYLEQQELYNAFRLNEPWDSPHNMRLIEKMPNVFKCPASELPAGQTTYLVPTGEAALFRDDKGPVMRDITDGTASTILLVEAGPDEATIWTKPQDYEVQPDQAVQKLTGNHEHGFLVALCDGTVRFVSVNVDATLLGQLFNPRDGQPPRTE